MRRYFSVRGGAGDLTKPDVNTRPQDNLYLAVNSEWLSKAKIPADRTSTGINLILDMRIEDKLMKDFAEFANGKKLLPDVANFEKAINYYKLAADFDKRNKDQAEPIKKDLSRLTSLKNFEEFNQKAAQLISSGYELPFDIYVSEDMKDTDHNALYATGPQLFLPDTTAYQVPDAEKLLAVLEKQTVKLLTMAGISEEQAKTWAKNGIEFDKKLSKILKSTEEWADEVAMYNPASLSDFEAKFDQFDINSFLKQLLPEMPEKVIVAEPRYFNHINDFLSESEFDEFKSWMILKFINKSATYLSQDFREAAFPFRQAVYGVPELPSQDKHAYRLANAAFDNLVVDPNKTLYENHVLINQERIKDILQRLNKKPDKSIWEMPGNLNNACYDPYKNDLTFPAGILQTPFYDAKQSRAANYGGIGATIGHEVSHAFDNNGAQFDEKGNMKNWWTKEDFAEFNKRTKAVADIFDGLQYGPVKLNGKQVVSENIADLSGLSCAIAANKAEGGEMKDLFKTYAKSWMQKQRPESIKAEVQSDVHAPQPTRVNIPAQNQEEFYEAYNVTPEDGMWLDPENRITIW